MELREYFRVVSARKWTVIQAILIVTITAIAVSMVQPKVYQGEAKVLVSEKDSSSALFGSVMPEVSSQPERALQTQVQLMLLRPLAEETVRKLSLTLTPEELLESVDVVAGGQMNVVTIRARSGDPVEAANIANTMADAYVMSSRDAKRESMRNAADEVEERLSQAESEILQLSQRISSEGKRDEFAAELQILTGTYTTLAEKLEQLRVYEQLETGSGRVVEQAIVESDPVEPSLVRNLALGLAVGLVLGLGMAFLYDYLDNTIGSNEDAEKIFGAPVLGSVPMEKFDKGVKRRLTIVDAPGSSAAEAYRVLRNSLDFINFEHQIKTLLVTSATPAEGKSTVAANLAASLAQSGKKVVLLSCDFRRPTTDQFFATNNVIGLSDVLLGTHTLKAALQRPWEDSLLVLSSGKLPPNPSELLGSARMESLIIELGEWADWVIIDSPPLLAVADPASVARWADGVLMVMRAGVSARDTAKKAVELLAKVGAHLVGVAVWGYEEAKPGRYGYYTGGYNYANYYDPYRAAPNRTAGGAALDTTPGADWVVEPTTGRAVATVVGRLLAGTMGFLIIAAILTVLAYLVGQYLGIDVLSAIRSVFP